MRLRPIHLTAISRIQQLNQKLKVALPREWRGQVLFELSALTNPELIFFLEGLKKQEGVLLRIDSERRLVLMNPLFCSLSHIPEDAPQSIKEACSRILQFLQGSELLPWRWGNNRWLDFNRAPFIMGILNVTPDSFSDGGKFYDPDKAVRHALQMVEEGAQIIDVGGESTRPGARPVSEEEELKRVVPVIAAIRAHSDVLISVDTYKSKVAFEALQAGADLVNDISGARFDPNMVRVVREAGCPIIIMHIKGTPRNMQKNPYYDDVVKEIYHYFEKRIHELSQAGIEMVAIDPGIGFGKRVSDNLQLIRDLKDFTFLNKPILMGTSRKSFIGAILNKETPQRLFGSLATHLMSVANGAHIIRVHDVAATRDAMQMHRAVLQGEWLANIS